MRLFAPRMPRRGLLTCNPFNVLRPRSNDTHKVINTHCTFVLFSPVYLHTEPRSAEHNFDPSTVRRSYLPAFRCAFCIPGEVAGPFLLPPLPSRDESPITATPLPATLTKKQGVGVVYGFLPHGKGNLSVRGAGYLGPSSARGMSAVPMTPLCWSTT